MVAAGHGRREASAKVHPERRNEDDDSIRLARVRVRAARRTVLLFLIFGIVWVVSTDHLVNVLFPEHSVNWEEIQTFKGMIFVVLASLLIYFSIIRYAERVLAAELLAHERLGHTEREFQVIVETMGEGICTLDLDNRLLYVNRRFCEIVGRDPGELLGIDLFDILERSASGDSTLPVRLAGLADDSEVLVCRKEDGAIEVSMTTVPRYDSEGREIGTLRVVNDLTPFRRSEAETTRLHARVEQMTRIESLGKLAGTMAHEFNNVMAGILPFTEVIARIAHGDERIESATRYIREAVNRGRRVSQEVLRFARPIPPDRKVITVAELIERIARLGESIFGGRYDLRIELSAGEQHLDIDLEQIEQVFMNLLINAREAIDLDGMVEVASRRDPPDTTYEYAVVPRPDRYVHFSVADNGCGIPKSVVNRVFEPLVTTKRRGTGLGLAVTYQIVTSHFGLIFAESTEGKGTAIHLFLPIATELPEAIAAQSEGGATSAFRPTPTASHDDDPPGSG